MTLDQINQLIFDILSNQNLIAKAILLLLLALYVLFALIVVLQIRILNNIIDQIRFSPVFRLLALIHVIAAVGLLIITVVVV